MRWSDQLTLISETAPGGGEEAADEHGFGLPQEGGLTTVYANKKSVGYGEFFKAKMAGYNEELKFDVFTAEYAGQTLAEYNGRRYTVLRTYIDPEAEGEYTELTLSDILKKK